jgi:uncharacterized protein YozE (UPF0346 family)
MFSSFMTYLLENREPVGHPRTADFNSNKQADQKE